MADPAGVDRVPRDQGPLRRLESEYQPDSSMSLRNYALLAGTYAAAVGGFTVAFRRSGRHLPGVGVGDVVLLGVATFKASRLLSRAKVTSFLRAPVTRFKRDAPGPEVDEVPRGTGMRHSIGELVTCPFCLSQWTGTALTGLFLVSPPAGRAVAGLLTALTVSDGLQYAETALQRAAH